MECYEKFCFRGSMETKSYLLLVSFVIATILVNSSFSAHFSFQRDYIGAYYDCEAFEHDLQKCETKDQFNKALKRAYRLRQDCEHFQESFEDNEIARQYNKCVVQALYVHLKRHIWRSEKIPQKLEISNSFSELDVRSVVSIASSSESTQLFFERSYSDIWQYEVPSAATERE